jgi:hypothetical protein
MWGLDNRRKVLFCSVTVESSLVRIQLMQKQDDRGQLTNIVFRMLNRLRFGAGWKGLKAVVLWCQTKTFSGLFLSWDSLFTATINIHNIWLIWSRKNVENLFLLPSWVPLQSPVHTISDPTEWRFWFYTGVLVNTHTLVSTISGE